MKCRCGKRAIYYRKWEGHAYCKECFSRQLEKRFRKTVSKSKLLKKGDKIAVALSGGKDSAVLLYLMHSISKDIPIELFAISIEEGIKTFVLGFRILAVSAMNSAPAKTMTSVSKLLASCANSKLSPIMSPSPWIVGS